MPPPPYKYYSFSTCVSILLDKWTSSGKSIEHTLLLDWTAWPCRIFRLVLPFGRTRGTFLSNTQLHTVRRRGRWKRENRRTIAGRRKRFLRPKGQVVPVGHLLGQTSAGPSSTFLLEREGGKREEDRDCHFYCFPLGFFPLCLQHALLSPFPTRQSAFVSTTSTLFSCQPPSEEKAGLEVSRPQCKKKEDTR